MKMNLTVAEFCVQEYGRLAFVHLLQLITLLLQARRQIRQVHGIFEQIFEPFSGVTRRNSSITSRSRGGHVSSFCINSLSDDMYHTLQDFHVIPINICQCRVIFHRWRHFLQILPNPKPGRLVRQTSPSAGFRRLYRRLAVGHSDVALWRGCHMSSCHTICGCDCG